jgi:Schlafen, AlbA_2
LQWIFGLSNEKDIFEGVHHDTKICLLMFKKGGITESFLVDFRINTREAIELANLDNFFNAKEEHLIMDLSMLQSISSESLKIPEIRNKEQVAIFVKLRQSPTLGESLSGTWNVDFGTEFNMTTDSYLFRNEPGITRLPLFEGKVINQFTHLWQSPKYWLEENEARSALLGKTLDVGQPLEYQEYRIGFRDVTKDTNERTLISTVLPKRVFCPHTMSLIKGSLLDNKRKIYLVTVLNSFVIDYIIKRTVTNHVSFVYAKQLPVLRLTESDPRFAPIVARAARLICTAPEYDDLAKEVGLGDHTAGVTDPAERNKLRAELDAMVAHLYELSESELTHILASFPLVEQAQKDAVLAAFRALAPHPDDTQVAALIADGEGERVELKVAVIWNARTGQKDGSMRENVVQAVAAYLNSYEGGAVIIGVENGTNRVVGLADDYAAANPQKRDRDGYELWLRDTLGSSLGQAIGVYYSVSFHGVGGAEVCRIQVRPADTPVYYNGDLYVRIGNGKKKLSAQQAMEYVKQRWGRNRADRV